ncbi:NAD dependent epimerase/dehydratase family protein-like protein [Macroventuria anomochaeta]|uniref:NAD dependent epimerase/dehydratase family protein-like protein n=1 Tax=Macroventuria anomochaeta TaxID=301207 RepID=A0ACB6RR16_9PLEO|nr:NAD dependent epimerase/dehydratase family protein-like protein [Macroventuria anomochaeta]KAF2624486.1 NAD dependent epimerase/dehydratase family protein-like protein [Macroventuria anomochaeta]
MATAALAGSTGLVGSNILSQLLVHPSFSSVYAYARREVPNPTATTKLNPLTSTDTSTWTGMFPRESNPKIFFSGLGTTKAQAGSFEAQRKIDYDLNLDLAKTAKEAGVETYVLISAGNANAQSSFAYIKMKGQLEDDVKALGFKHTVLVHPGLILGGREDSRPAEFAIQSVAKLFRSVTPKLTDFWAQDATTIAKAAVNAGVQCLEGKKEEGVWVLGQAEINALGEA